MRILFTLALACRLLAGKGRGGLMEAKYLPPPLVRFAGEYLGASQQPSFQDLADRAEALVDSNPAEAVNLFQQAVAMRPDWSEGWLYMGASLYHLGRFAEAKKALSKGAALEPRKGTPRAFIGLCDFELGDFDGALKNILAGEQIGLADNPPFQATVRYHTALIYIRRNDFHHAVEHLQPLAGNIDAFPDILTLLGAGVLKIPSPVPPEKQTLVTLAGKATFAYYALRLDEARAAFAQLETDYPKEPGVHYAEGIYWLHDQPDRALEEFRKELEINSKSVLALQQIALLQIKNVQNDAAIATAKQALQIDPSNAVCQSALGRALLANGNLEESIEALKQAVKLAPNDPQMHFHLERAYRRGGHVEEAKREKAEFDRLSSLVDPLEIAPTSVAQ